MSGRLLWPDHGRYERFTTLKFNDPVKTCSGVALSGEPRRELAGVLTMKPFVIDEHPDELDAKILIEDFRREYNEI